MKDVERFKELASQLEGLSEEGMIELLRKQKDQFDQDGLEERQRERDPFAPGRWVILDGLETEDLNGKSFEIIRAVNNDGRLGVRTHKGDKLIKKSNIQAFPDDSIVKVARIGARGELTAPDGVGGVRTWHWPRKVLETLPSELSPISILMGVPVFVTKVEPHSKLKGDAMDNYYASEFMVAPETGLVPLKWQTGTGPVVLWRGDFNPLSADDACLMRNFISGLIKDNPDGRNMVDSVTPDVFQDHKRRTLEQEKKTPWGEQSEDVNI